MLCLHTPASSRVLALRTQYGLLALAIHILGHRAGDMAESRPHERPLRLTVVELPL